MFINVLLLICALSLSTVAAYYSIIGLATIFAGAFWPVVIMGSLLEASKIVVSSWLYRKWDIVPILLKSYLTTAVVILMMITSVGIFGFLSKAHIEQTGQIQENQAQIERYDSEIARQKFLYEKAEQRLRQLENTGTGTDVNTQNQINVEQQRIDNAYQRIQPAIDEQNKIIDNQTKIIVDQITDIDRQLETLQKYIDSQEIAKAQSLVGTRADGNWGTGTAAAVRAWQQNKKDEKINLVSKLEDINKNNSLVKTARNEIQRLRQTVEMQVADSNKLINRLREQLGKTNVEDVSILLNEQQNIIKNSNQEIDRISEKKFALESQYRKLEAEVGPIKYIANFIYNNSDKNLLEKSVTWMIIIIILVFDPLAVLMIISANLGFLQDSRKISNSSGGNNNISHDPQTKQTQEELKLELNTAHAGKQHAPIISQDTILPIIKTVEEQLSKNTDETDLTEITPVLQSTVEEQIPEDKIETIMNPVQSNKQLIKLDADEIINRISKNRPVVRYDAKREWNGYKH